MHPERFAALAEITKEALIGERVVRLDPGFQDILFGYSNEELSEVLHIAAEAKRQFKAEAYYCQFILPCSKKGGRYKECIAVYLDEQHTFVLLAGQDVDQIVNKEFARRVAKAKEATLTPSELEQVLANWIDQAVSGPGTLAPGVNPAAWAAAQFLTWWRGQVTKQLATAEKAVSQLIVAEQAKIRLDLVEEALADLRASIASPRGPDEIGRTRG